MVKIKKKPFTRFRINKVEKCTSVSSFINTTTKCFRRGLFSGRNLSKGLITETAMVP